MARKAEKTPAQTKPTKRTTAKKAVPKKAPAKKTPAKKTASREPKVTVALAAKHGLSKAELALVKDRLGRFPSHTELGVIGAMWSESGCRKSSRIHLAKLPTDGSTILSTNERLGVVDVGSGLAAVLRMHSQNRSCDSDPSQGAAMGIGSVLTQVASSGASPIASLSSLRMGESSRHRTRQQASSLVDGVAAYSIEVGVPAVGGDLCFDDCYNDNLVFNVMSLGVCRHDDLVSPGSYGPGSALIIAGAETGGEVPFSEQPELQGVDGGTTEAVQQVVPSDPHLQRRILAATRELIEKDLVQDVHALGPAGLIISAVQAGNRVDSGIELDVGEVPWVEKGLKPYECLRSGSPDRILVVVAEGLEDDVLSVLAGHELDCAAIGRVTETGLFEVRKGGKSVCELPIALLTGAAPKHDRATERPTYLNDLQPVDLEDLPSDLAAAILDLAGSPNLSDRRAIVERCGPKGDTEPWSFPGSDAALVRIPGTDLILSISLDGNSRYSFLNPRLGAQLSVAECARNISVTGANPVAAVACFNFGDPEDPAVMWQFAETAEGLADAVDTLETPVVSGVASFFNESDGVAIYPTPTVGMMGVFERPPRPGRLVGPGFRSAGDRVLLFGETFIELDGSEWAHLNGFLGVAPPRLDWNRELAVQALARELIARGWVNSAHDLSGGGLAIALVEAAYYSTNSALGVELSADPQLAPAAWLFSESASRVLVSVPLDRVDQVLQVAVQMGVPAAVIGKVRSDTFSWVGHFKVSLTELRSRYEHGLADIL